MNISDKRIQLEIDNIIKENLVDGHLPTSNEVVGSLSRYIYQNNLSMPIYDYSKIYKEFQLKDLNKAKIDVANDLDITFSSILDLYAEIESEVNKFDSEKKKFDYKVNQLQSTLFNLANQYSTSGYTEAFVENIVDMQNFNISLSDCDIDLQAQDITLKKLQDKPYTNISKIYVETKDKIITNGSLKEYINKSGAYWQGIIYKKKQEPTTLSLIIDFGKQININKVQMRLPLLKPAQINISTSNSLDKWISQYTGITEGMCLANTQGHFRYMKVDILKEEADKYYLGEYEYHFLVDTVEFYHVNYASKSTLISTPIKTNSNINKVSLVDESIKPNSTNIKYYIALNSETPNWIEITPLNDETSKNNKVITFNTIQIGKFKDILLSPDVSPDAYKLFTANGQSIYAIDEVKNVTVTKNSLYKGINSWRVDKLDNIESVEEPINKTLFLRNKTSDKLSTYYQPLLIGNLLRNEEFSTTCALKYTTTIDCPRGIKPKSSQVISTHPMSIYLNGKLIFSGTPNVGTEITYAFKEGKNVLEFIINVNKMNTQDDNPIAKVSADINMDLSKISTQIYADPDPMREVSLFNLKYNTNNEKDVYTFRKVNDGYQVLVKDDDLRINYRLSHDFIVQDSTELLVKAELSREFENINITPRLQKYEIRII